MTAVAASPPDWRARSANQTRLAFGQALLELAAGDPRVVVLSADTQDLLGIRSYIDRHADRFVEVGIAEQNAIGVAAGLATTGLRPYVCCYAPFITARSMEQVRNDVAYANQRVVIGAAASGISLGVAGGTHHALEDLALMRSLPRMTVIVPADVEEAYRATLATRDIDGPVYLRLGGRVDEPSVTPPGAPFRVGRAVELRPGDDVAVIACGALVEMAVRAADALRAEGIAARVLNMHTIKPLDREAVLAAAAETRGIVTAEEHHLTGGLGGAVAELLAVERPTRMRMVGMPDAFAMVGPTGRVRARYGMSAEAIAAACRDLIGASSPAPR
ncbi:MAG TPA: transketolase C-terminal domain-containing protein [Candidatus Methylomirabilis sp.]|nr:transketolase C-terminal domain-containing protein [Candidatus Methylomirabilis sp.]